MKHYLNVFSHFVKTSAAKQLSFRAHFTLVVVMELFYYATGIFTVEFLYDHTTHIGPWDKNTFMFFTSFIFLQDNFKMILTAHNYWQFSDDLKTGNFDFIVLKPLSSIFTVFFRFFRFSTIVTLPISGGILIYFGSKIGLSIASWILIPFLVVLCFILQTQIEMIISTAMFWTTQGNGINFLRMQMQEVREKPEFIYHSAFRKFIVFAVPLAFTASLPVQFILDITKYHLFIGLVISIITTNLVLKKLWKIGLSKYESASS